MRRAWVVRAGEAAQQIDAMRAANQVGVKFVEVGDAREWTPQRIQQEIAKTDPDGAPQQRSWLLRFTFDITIGDLVVTQNVADREVWLSVVTGPYEFSESPVVGGYRHTRRAEWMGWVDRDVAWLANKLKYIETPAAVTELRDPDWWFDQLAMADVVSSPPNRAQRAMTRPAPAKRAQSTRAPSPRAPSPRAPRAPAPPPPPKKPDRILCAGQCGLQWHLPALVDGLCPDCRGD